MINTNTAIGGAAFAVGAAIAAKQKGSLKTGLGLFGALLCTGGVILVGGTITGVFPVIGAKKKEA